MDERNEAVGCETVKLPALGDDEHSDFSTSESSELVSLSKERRRLCQLKPPKKVNKRDNDLLF